MGNDTQLLGPRPYSPANDGGSGRISTRMAGILFLREPVILIRFLQLHTTGCKPVFIDFSSMATSGKSRRWNELSAHLPDASKCEIGYIPTELSSRGPWKFESDV